MKAYRYVRLTDSFFKLLSKMKDIISLFNKKPKDNLQILDRFKCQINNHKAKVFITDRGIMIKQGIYIGKVVFEDIKKIRIKEKTWSIRVEVFDHHHCHTFDFKTHREAFKFYSSIFTAKNLEKLN
ncbi:MAG: hypothetical protein AB9856_01545 [Cellulosilyticaceae bacterium]